MKKLLYILLFVPLTFLGQDNYSLSFDGVDDYIDLGSNLFNSNQGTISARIKFNNTLNNLNPIFSQHDIDVQDNGMQLSVWDDTAIFRHDHRLCYETGWGADHPTARSFHNLNEDSWIDLSVTSDGNNWKMYIDGLEYDYYIQEYSVESANGQWFFDLCSDSKENYIGRYKRNISDDFLDGLIDQVQVWDRPLTQEEIQNYISCHPTGNESSLIGFWNFNEGSGNTVYDISGNGNHGIIHGATFSDDVPEQNCEDLALYINIEGYSYLGSFEDNNYYISDNHSYWEEANALCSALGGNLATISSEEENAFILECLSQLDLSMENLEWGVWIGLYYSDNQWNWVTGEAMDFINWDQSEPSNNSSYGQFYTGLTSGSDVPGSWDDVQSQLKRHILELSPTNYIVNGCMNQNAINFDATATIDDEESCIYSQDYVHGLWNQVEDGLIQYNESVESLSSLQQALDNWNSTIDLSAGWNMFGYGCPISIDLAEGLSNHTDKIIIVKDNNGNVYMPEFGFNGIGEFTPGFGYQIKVTEEIYGFSLCDWYVNDIPEDDIVSLQDSLDILQGQVFNLECINQGGCSFNVESNTNRG